MRAIDCLCDSQMERNRPPVRFTVERWNIATTAEEPISPSGAVKRTCHMQEERAADLRDENVALQRKKRQLEEDCISDPLDAGACCFLIPRISKLVMARFEDREQRPLPLWPKADKGCSVA